MTLPSPSSCVKLWGLLLSTVYLGIPLALLAGGLCSLTPPVRTSSRVSCLWQGAKFLADFWTWKLSCSYEGDGAQESRHWRREGTGGGSADLIVFSFMKKKDVEPDNQSINQSMYSSLRHLMNMRIMRKMCKTDLKSEKIFMCEKSSEKSLTNTYWYFWKSENLEAEVSQPAVGRKQRQPPQISLSLYMGSPGCLPNWFLKCRMDRTSMFLPGLDLVKLGLFVISAERERLVCMTLTPSDIKQGNKWEPPASRKWLVTDLLPSRSIKN